MIYLYYTVEIKKDQNGNLNTVRNYSISNIFYPEFFGSKKNRLILAQTNYPEHSLFGIYYLECLVKKYG